MTIVQKLERSCKFIDGFSFVGKHIIEDTSGTAALLLNINQPVSFIKYDGTL